MSLVVRSSKKQHATNQSALFWSRVERIFGEIPTIIRMILEYNGFDSYLALKGIFWDDKKYFFQALEESITGLSELNDDDSLKKQFKKELAIYNQNFNNFKLKLGHKNLIVNLCHELQKTNLEEFNHSNDYQTTVTIPDNTTSRTSFVQQIVVKRKKDDDEHGYSREDKVENSKVQDTSVPENDSYHLQEQQPEIYESEQIQYIYENDEDGSTQFIDQTEYDGTEIVEYHEVIEEEEDAENDSLYAAEQAVKQEVGAYEQSYDGHYAPYPNEITHENRSSNEFVGVKNSKRPKHMYSDEFLQTQSNSSGGKIGTPGRRRPKIQKNYPTSEEGTLDRWKDLVRQSCEVIVPQELLSKYDLSKITITKMLPFIWEVLCPLCGKKIRLQLTHEGKYLNFKRSNFERHLRIVHYKQILKFKPEQAQSEGHEEEEEMVE